MMMSLFHHGVSCFPHSLLLVLFVASLSVSAFQMTPYHSKAPSMETNTLQVERQRSKRFILGANSDEDDKVAGNSNEIGNDFKPNKPISLPSLENPPDAGPLFNTCRSVTGVEKIQDGNNDSYKNDDIKFIPNKPIQLDSLKNQDLLDRSFLGLQPRSGDEGEVPLLMETGLGLFTSSLILGGSIYFILAVFLDGDNVDPTAIPLSF